MARVPTYDTARVAPSGGAISAPSTNPTLVAGQQIERAGDALGDASGRAIQIGNQLLNEVNLTRVQQAANQLTNAATNLRYGNTDANGMRTPGYTEIQGESVMHATGPDGQTMPLTQAYPRQLQKQADEIMAGLTPAQQRMFGMHVSATMAQFNNEVAAHSAQQLGVWRATVNNDTLTSAANSLASALPQMGTPQFDVMSGTATQNANGAINRMLADKGVISLDQEGKPVFADDNARTVYDTESKALRGKFISTIVQAGVNNQQAPQALKYLESQKAFMAPDDYARAHAQVIQAAVGTTAVDQVDNVMGTVWTDHSAAPDLEKIDAQLRAANHDNPDQLTASRAEVRSRLSNWTFNREQANEQATQKAGEDIAKGKSIAYIQAQPYWGSLNGSAKLAITNQANSFAEQALGHTFTAAGRAGQLDPGIIAYAMDAHNLSEGQARALAALVVGEGGQLDNVNTDGGGHGAYGLFQIRDSGGLQAMRKLYGDHPTMQQQVDYFLQHYSKGNNAFWNATSESAAFQALAQGQGAAGGTQGILDRGGAALMASTGAKGGGQQQAEQWIANPGQLGPATPENTRRIISAVGSYWAPKVLAAQKAYQNQVTRQAVPNATEVNAVLGQLGISVTAKDPETVGLRANIRAGLNQALLVATKNGDHPLTPAERSEVIQKAAAVTVQTEAGLFSGPGETPILRSRPEIWGRTIIPDSARAGTAQKMAELYKATGDRRFAPTPQNLQNYYLMANGLMEIPGGK